MAWTGIKAQLQAAGYCMVHDWPGGAVALSPYLDKAPASLSREVSPANGDGKLGLVDAVRLSTVTGDLRILMAFAAAMGHAIVPLPDSAGDEGMSSVEVVGAVNAALSGVCEALAKQERRQITDNDRKVAREAALLGMRAMQSAINLMEIEAL